MGDDDDTYDDRDDGAGDKRQGSGFHTASLTPQSAFAQILSTVTGQTAGQTLANRLLGKFDTLANLLAVRNELLAFDGMKPQGVKLLCN